MSVTEQNLEPPTLSEVVRLINGLTNRIDDALKGVVSRYEYTADRQGMDLKFNRSDEIHVELKTLIIEVRAEAAKEVAEIKTDAERAVLKVESRLEAKIDTYIAAQAESKTRLNLLVVGAALTGVSGLVIAVINQLMLGG